MKLQSISFWHTFLRALKRPLGWGLSLAVFVAACTNTIDRPPVFYPELDNNWQLTFEDQFDGPLDTTIWNVEIGPWKDGVRVKENAVTNNGLLTLRTSKVDGEYRSAFLRTRKLSNLLFSQKHGYFEVRMKLSTAPGQWAAFWLMPKGTIHNVDQSGRDGTEIDIVEGFGPEVNTGINQAIHYDGYAKPHKRSLNNRYDMKGKVDAWHTYGLKWTDADYTWFVDGIAVWKVEDTNVVSQVEQYMLLTTEVLLGRDWVGHMVDENLPADTLVDYVRVYKNVPETPNTP